MDSSQGVILRGLQILSQNRFLLRVNEWADVDYLFDVIAFFSGRNDHDKLFDLSSSYEELSAIMTKIALSGGKKYSPVHSNYISDIRKCNLSREALEVEFYNDSSFMSMLGLALIANRGIYIKNKNIARFVAGLIYSKDREFIKSVTKDISILAD